ncbi:MAG: hypothetical protein AAFR64_05990 [Pseudomonadota bacterium]
MLRALASFFLLISITGIVLASPTKDKVCTLPEGWNEVTAKDPRFVVFGELHGTKETPAFIGNLLCALTQSEKRVLLAIELWSIDDRGLQAVWEQPFEGFAEALRKDAWPARQDGVGSEAMLDLVVEARSLKHSGHDIAVTAFSGVKDEDQQKRFAHLPGQGPHEAAQAQNIFDAAEASDFDLVIVLVGNLHARKDAISRGGITYDPMVKRLSAFDSVVSLDVRYGAGSYWACIREDGETICKSRPTGGYEVAKEAPHIALDPRPEGKRNPRYDGYFWVGPISASPPAVSSPLADK